MKHPWNKGWVLSVIHVEIINIIYTQKMLQNHFDNLDQRIKTLARKSQQEPQIKL
jgi:hypothetical protein